ncbi:MAG: type IV secretion system protein DotC [Legionellales bacterium RIFCSPHIGHO2_12_FULL_42_9]|nr:MAG: type IV secretion system protein DotC [Legionellales bacterium RIFCSPHIGHO2_12_FULL_42_9]
MSKLTHKITDHLYIWTIILGVVCLLTACASPVKGNTDSLDGLKAMGKSNDNWSASSSRKNDTKIRDMALKEMALSLGAQGGLACRAKAIDEALSKQARYLDSVFDFNSLLIDNNIMPPVLLEGRNTLNMPDTQAIRISDRTYKVAKQAHFVTTPPNWHQYLWMDYKKPEPIDSSFLPKTKPEQHMWDLYVTKGWHKGFEQANTILEENLARIKEDLDGMILYRKLLAMNMVSAPFVSHTDLGITGDASEIHIDDRVLRITALPALNLNSQEWRAAIAKDENILEQFTNMEKSVQAAKITISGQSWQPTISPIS